MARARRGRVDRVHGQFLAGRARPRRRDPGRHQQRSSLSVANHLGQASGCAGRAKASESAPKYIITEMYAKTVQGMAPEESVKRAEGEFRRVCSA